MPDSVLKELLAAAFTSGQARDANQLIHDVRERTRAAHGYAFAYEVSLLDDDWSVVGAGIAQRFRDFMRSKGFSRAGAPSVFVSLFHAGRLYFIRSADFIGIVRPLLRSASLPPADDPSLPVPVDPADHDA